jgi:hypothetical protein
MKSTFRPLSCASLLLAATLSFASLSPAGAQSPQVGAPPSQPAAVTCSAGLKLCGCKGSADCAILKKFADAGGCSNRRCADDICVCNLDALVRGDSPLWTAARQHNLVKPNPLDKLGPRPRPVKDCSATAQCGNKTIACSIKGDGVCQGKDGIGVHCQAYTANGGLDGTPQATCQ